MHWYVATAVMPIILATPLIVDKLPLGAGNFTVKFGVNSHPLCTTLALKGGGGLTPNFMEFVVVNAHGGCFIHILNTDAKQVSYNKRMVQGRWRFTQVENNL